MAYSSPVSISLGITEEWYTYKKGVISEKKPNAPIVDRHSVCIVGYDNNKAQLKFVNSWGPEWGQHGFGIISYDYFKKYATDAWSTVLFKDSTELRQESDIEICPWFTAEWPNNIFIGIDIYDSKNNELIAWSFMDSVGPILEVNELFVKPKFRGRGFGSLLVAENLRIALNYQKTLRYWVPRSDMRPENLSVTKKLLKTIGITLRKVNFWCSDIVGY